MKFRKNIGVNNRSYIFIFFCTYILVCLFRTEQIYAQDFNPQSNPALELKPFDNNESLLNWIILEGEEPLYSFDLINNNLKDAEVIDLSTNTHFPVKKRRNYWFNIELNLIDDLADKYISLTRGGNCFPWEMTFYKVEAFQYQMGKMTSIGLSGNSIPSSLRDTPKHINPSIISLKKVKAEAGPVWVRLSSAEGCNMQIKIQLENFETVVNGRRLDSSSVVNILLYGATFVLLFISIFIFLKYREPIYLWFIIFLAFFFLNRLYLGFGNELFNIAFKFRPRLFILFFAIAVTGQTVFLLQFWRSFVNSFDQHPKVNKIVGWLIAYLLIFSVVNTAARFVDWDFSFLASIKSMFLLLFFIVLSSVSIYLVFKGKRLAKFISIGIVLVSLTLCVSIVLVNIYTQIDRAILEGIVGFEMIFVFTLALAYRFVIVNDQKEAVLLEKVKIEKLNSEQLQKINAASNKFVPNAFLSFLGKKNILQAALGDNKEQEVSILFSDIRNFTAISEKMSPQETFKFVSDFNKEIGPIITNNNGFINQFLGDGIMAIFPNEPNDALNAALEMIKYQMLKSSELRQQTNIQLEIGIGIHYGSIIMGIMGDEQRYDAASIADAVNLASRIEQLTKKYASPILFSEDYYNRINNKDKHFIRRLGLTKVKGKENSVSVFQCLDYLGDTELKDTERLVDSFGQAIKLLEQQKEEEAILIFEKLLQLNPKDKTCKALYEIARSKIGLSV